MIKNQAISQFDIEELNDIDELITLGCLNIEQSLKHSSRHIHGLPL